jgi:uncharacterized membrane protein (UPF0127 family)
MMIHAGEHRIDAHVARTDEHRALGLMHRTSMAPNEGMLFVCDEPSAQSFWMKDTPLDLSIAFIADDGTIVHVGDLEAHSLEPYRCEHPVRYILEVRQGWFAERGIAAGTRLEAPAFVAALQAA